MVISTVLASIICAPFNKISALQCVQSNIFKSPMISLYNMIEFRGVEFIVLLLSMVLRTVSALDSSFDVNTELVKQNV